MRCYTSALFLNVGLKRVLVVGGASVHGITSNHRNCINFLNLVMQISDNLAGAGLLMQIIDF